MCCCYIPGDTMSAILSSSKIKVSFFLSISSIQEQKFEIEFYKDNIDFNVPSASFVLFSPDESL